jgi:hypothetical protein
MPSRSLRVRLDKDLIRRLEHLAIDAEVYLYEIVDLLLEAAFKALDTGGSPRLVELFRRDTAGEVDTRTIAIQLSNKLRSSLKHLKIDWEAKRLDEVMGLLLLRMVEALWKEREGTEEPWPLFLSIKERDPDIALLQRLLDITDGEEA